MTFNHPRQAEEQAMYMNRCVSAGQKKKTAPQPGGRKTACQEMNDAIYNALTKAVMKRNQKASDKSNSNSTDLLVTRFNASG